MKRDMYDIFDHLGDDFEELPNLKTRSAKTKAETDHLTKRVFEKADIKPVRTKKAPCKVIAIAAAVTIIAGGTLTAGAVSGKMEEFFRSVSKAEISDARPSENLPAVKAELPDAIAEMEQFYSCPDTVFTQNESGSIELVGLYSDNSTMMISFRLTLNGENTLSNNVYMLSYFTLTLPDGTVKELTQSGYLTEPFVKSETEENVYYMTYYLTDPEFSGATLHTEFIGAYTQEQAANVHEKLIALDDELYNKYNAADMSTGEWKKFQHENDFDEIRRKTRREAFEAEESAINGNWQADTQLPALESEPFVIETERNKYSVDKLSIMVSDDKDEDEYSDKADFSKEEYIGSAVYLSDGTVFITDSILKEKASLTGNIKACPFAWGASFAGSDTCDGVIYSFTRPVDQSEIVKITEYRHYYTETDPIEHSMEEHITENVIFGN